MWAVLALLHAFLSQGVKHKGVSTYLSTYWYPLLSRLRNSLFVRYFAV
jgi:hypothetical protein